MKKLIVSLNVTMDGFISGPQGELDWHFRFWNDDMALAVAEELGNTDTIILGRVTYEAMAAYWPAQTLNPSFSRQDIPYADMMNSHRKIVFSTTLRRARWNNTVIVSGLMSRVIKTLKAQPGRDIIVYGSYSVVRTLMQLGLVDEYHIWQHPVLLRNGQQLFTGTDVTHSLKISERQQFSNGVILFFYTPVTSDFSLY